MGHHQQQLCPADKSDTGGVTRDMHTQQTRGSTSQMSASDATHPAGPPARHQSCKTSSARRPCGRHALQRGSKAQVADTSALLPDAVVIVQRGQGQEVLPGHEAASSLFKGRVMTVLCVTANGGSSSSSGSSSSDRMRRCAAVRARAAACAPEAPDAV